MSSESTKNPDVLRFCEIPDLKTHKSVYAFDCLACTRELSGRRILRPCLPFELPAGRYEELSKGGRLVLLIVESLNPGELLKNIVSCPENDRAEMHSERFTHHGEFAQSIDARGEVFEVYAPEGALQ